MTEKRVDLFKYIECIIGFRDECNLTHIPSFLPIRTRKEVLESLNLTEEDVTPKPKVKRAQALLYYAMRPFVYSDLFKDREEIIQVLGSSVTILEFPYGEWKEFDE